MRTTGTKILMITAATAMLSVGSAWSQPRPAFEKFFTEHFEGGPRGFLEMFYQQVQYPLAARSNCGIGLLHVLVTVNEDRGLKQVIFLNDFGMGIEGDVSRIMKRSDARWFSNGDVDTLRFTIGYQLGDYPNFESDLSVTAYGYGGSSASSACLSNEALMQRIDKLIDKKKYEQVPALWKELLRRGYEGEDFRQLQGQHGREFSPPAH